MSDIWASVTFCDSDDEAFAVDAYGEETASARETPTHSIPRTEIVITDLLMDGRSVDIDEIMLRTGMSRAYVDARLYDALAGF